MKVLLVGFCMSLISAGCFMAKLPTRPSPADTLPTPRIGVHAKSIEDAAKLAVYRFWGHGRDGVLMFIEESEEVIDALRRSGAPAVRAISHSRFDEAAGSRVDIRSGQHGFGLEIWQLRVEGQAVYAKVAFFWGTGSFEVMSVWLKKDAKGEWTISESRTDLIT